MKIQTLIVQCKISKCVNEQVCDYFPIQDRVELSVNCFLYAKF